MNNFFEKETLKPEMRPHAVYFKQNIETEMFSFRERNLGKVNWNKNLSLNYKMKKYEMKPSLIFYVCFWNIWLRKDISFQTGKYLLIVYCCRSHER